MDRTEVKVQDYALFRDFLESQCGIVLGNNKQYLVRSRLLPIVREHNYESLTHLIDKVVNGRQIKLREEVVDAMTTNETLWFRDNYPFELLQKSLFDEFNQLNRPLRIWCSACSSGQEPYSIAMSYLEFKKSNPGKLSKGIEVIATDLSRDMLDKAKNAEYDSLSIARGLSSSRQRDFFTKLENGNLKVKPEVTRLVSFKPINLLDSYTGLGRFDVVFCRNVLIYFSQDVKRKILQQIAAGLQNEGVLFLGASESISGLTDSFTMMRCSPGLYYRKKSQ